MNGARFHEWLGALAAERDKAGLHRRLRVRRAGDARIDLAGNDYLGLARDPRVIEAAVDATRVWGAGSTGSRLVTGTTELHEDLELALARFTGAERALVFATGYAANLAVVSALADADTLIVSDERNHASLIDGCRLSRARVAVARHADADDVDRLLEMRDAARAIVVTDGVFSTDGEVAALAELHAISRRHGAVLVVDEAHSLGVLGPKGAGVAVEAGIQAEPDVVRTITLSKALGSQGGAVLAGDDVIEHLVDTARTFIFDTGLAPACAGAARRALEILQAEPTLPERARERAQQLASGLGVPPPSAVVVSVVLGDPHRALAVADRCREHGVDVGCFRPPSVPAGTSRLRLTARADLTDADIRRATGVVLDALRSLP
jgi:8-amino-7-oxononanoate synthase